MPTQPAKTVAQLLNHTSRLIARIGDERLRKLGFRYAQVPVLALLRGGRAVTQAELVLRTGVEQSSIAQLLARMERDGEIERRPDPKDARSRVVTVTRATAERLPEASKLLGALDRKATAGLSADEVATLVRLLEHVHRNLEKRAESS